MPGMQLTWIQRWVISWNERENERRWWASGRIHRGASKNVSISAEVPFYKGLSQRGHAWGAGDWTVLRGWFHLAKCCVHPKYRASLRPLPGRSWGGGVMGSEGHPDPCPVCPVPQLGSIFLRSMTSVWIPGYSLFRSAIKHGQAPFFTPPLPRGLWGAYPSNHLEFKIVLLLGTDGKPFLRNIAISISINPPIQ